MGEGWPPYSSPLTQFCPVATAARCFDAEHIPALERHRGPGAQRLPVEQIPPRRAAAATADPERRVTPPFGEQRGLDLRERLVLPHHTLPTPPPPGSSASAPQGIRPDAERVLQLEHRSEEHTSELQSPAH